jgi:hypothetical protein
MEKLAMSNPVHRLAVESIEEVIDYNNLVAHELANLMPMIEGKKVEELMESVRKGGLQYPIILFEGKILDGRNRYRALKTINHVFTSADFEVFEGTRDEAETKVIDLNMVRRQMTNKEKEEVIQRMILKYHDDSNRGIARRCNITSHAQVGTVRERMLNPPEKKKFEEFCKEVGKFLDLLYKDAGLRTEFKNRFGREFRELLAL